MNRAADFNPSRLTWARRRRGLTKTQLAGAIAVELRSVSAYENGEFAPEMEKLSRLSEILHFPIDFFSGDDFEQLSPDSTSFRSMSKMTARQRDMALGSGAIALLLNEWIEAKFELPQIELPNLGRDGSPEAAADALRREWGLGKLPVKNMVHLLEVKGVRVYSLALDALEVDAFSMWRGDRPFVFLNTQKSAEHSRFDAAHELGHLVLHRHAAPNGQLAEREADTFASAFLMPAGSVRAHAPRFATLENLIRLKKIWGVTLAAMTYRLHKLGVLTDWHYRTLYIQISSRGYRRSEPQSQRRESSQMLQKVLSVLRNEGVTKHEIAAELRLWPDEIEQLVFGLALTTLEGGRAERNRQQEKKPHLRLIGANDETNRE